jgi:hypothetical protein
MRFRVLSFFDRRKLIWICVAVAAILVLGGLYLWYASTYGNAKKIVVPSNFGIEYEWQEIASNNGIVTDFLWARTRSVMVEDASDGVLIPSSYVVKGRLATQPSAESGMYNLRDQAMLLNIYVSQGDRSRASQLQERVLELFASGDSGLLVSTVYADTCEGDKELEGLVSVYDNMIWLESFVNYYSLYGTSQNFDWLQGYVGVLFDHEGMPIVEDLSVETYIENAYVGVTDDELSEVDSQSGSLTNFSQEANQTQEQDEQMTAYVGVKISSIRLQLVDTLETNELLPEGSYDRLLQIVLDSRVSPELPLYAYAYTFLEDGSISYVYEANRAARISVSESVQTMYNLALVGQLPQESYAWLKTQLMNNASLSDTYSMISGMLEGDKATDVYDEILRIAYLNEDSSFFERVCSFVGYRVATLSSSEVLSMIFRSSNGRFICYASDNLGVFLALM